MDDAQKVEFKQIKENYIDGWLSLLKLMTFLSFPVGFIYLLSYTNANKITLPISLAELPTLLLSIFGLGSVLALILLGFIFLPTASKYGDMLSNDSIQIFGDVRKENIFRFIFLLAVPLFIFLLWFVFSVVGLFDGWNINIILCLLAILSFGYAIYKLYSKSRLRVAGFALYLLMVSSGWLLVGLVLVIKILANQFPHITNNDLILFVVIYAILMLVVLLLMIVPGDDQISIPRSFWVVIGMMVILLPPLINPLAVKLTEVSLNIMRIGGGYQTIYVIDEKYRDKLPCVLVNQDYPDRTPPLFVVLDVGGRIYVRTDNKDDEIVYTLPSEAVTTQIYWKGGITRSQDNEF